jgi:hypothetical protein
MFLLAAGTVGAQEAGPTGTATPPAGAYMTPTPTVAQKWKMSAIPWDQWFATNKDTITVTDKTDYVYFFWNVQNFKPNFEVKDKKIRLAESALQLVSRLYPADAKADLVKVDLVYILPDPQYGTPMLDTIQQVAHFEFLRSKISKLAKAKKEPSVRDIQKVFNQLVIY